MIYDYSLPLRSKKAGRGLRGFGRTRAPPNQSLPAFLNLKDTFQKNREMDDKDE